MSYVPPHLRKGNMTVSSVNSLPPAVERKPFSSTGLKRRTPFLLSAHADSFVGPLMLLKEGLIDVNRYSGATAKGINNPDSQSKVYSKLLNNIDMVKCPNILLQFGNVDIGIGSVFQLENKGPEQWNETKFIESIVENYLAFVKENILPRMTGSDAFIKKVIIVTVTLPVVEDEALPLSHTKYQERQKQKNAAKGIVEKAHAQEQLDGPKRKVEDLIPYCGIVARRRMTVRMNKMLEDFCTQNKELGFRILDINKYVCVANNPDESEARSGALVNHFDLLHINNEDSEEAGAKASSVIKEKSNADSIVYSQVVSKKYLSEDVTNLHLLWEETLPFWVEELEDVGINSSHMPKDLESSSMSYTHQKREQLEILRRRREGEDITWSNNKYEVKGPKKDTVPVLFGSKL